MVSKAEKGRLIQEQLAQSKKKKAKKEEVKKPVKSKLAE
jgi:hypothetical protein